MIGRTVAMGLSVAMLLLLTGCPESSPGAAAGEDGGPCYGNSTCNPGLNCEAGVCVAVGPPLGDSDAVDTKPQGNGSVTVLLYGPPTGTFPELDPFDHCSFLKLCYPLSGDAKLRGCDLRDYNYGQHQFDDFQLPLNVELSVVAECYAAAGFTPEPEPIEPAVSKGHSAPLKLVTGEDPQQVHIYMLPISTFGPTCTPPPPTAPPGSQGEVQNPFSERWGATVTELYDEAVLIAGGVDDFKTGCGDWSDPECVEKSRATAELYDPRDNTFTLTGVSGSSLLTQKRSFAAAVELPSGEVAIFGGLTSDGTPTKTVDIYDSVGFTFAPGQPMQETRAYHTASLISSQEDGFVLLVGGYGTGEGRWEIWTPDGGVVASGLLHESRFHHTATLIDKDNDSLSRQMVIIAGGEGGGSPGATTVRDSMEVFDIDKQQFDPMPYALCANEGTGTKKTMHAAAFVPARHFIYMAGGFNDAKHQSPVKDICVYNTKHEDWTGEAGTFLLKKGRGALTATSLPGNVVLFAGGLTKNNGELEAAGTVEIVFEYLNKDGSTVVDIGPGPQFPIPMLYPRWDHSATVAADGKVLFIGGLAGNPANPQMVSYSEVFNPQ